MRAWWSASRLGGLLVLAVCSAISIAACRTADDARGAARAPSAEEAARAASRRAGDLRRAFEETAAEARNDLDAARRSAEVFLSTRAAPTARQVEKTRQEARRALKRGEDVLGRAAEDGGRTAETWARVIQDRMMRLEETLKHLTGSRGHADS